MSAVWKACIKHFSSNAKEKFYLGEGLCQCWVQTQQVGGESGAEKQEGSGEDAPQLFAPSPLSLSSALRLVHQQLFYTQNAPPGKKTDSHFCSGSSLQSGSAGSAFLSSSEQLLVSWGMRGITLLQRGKSAVSYHRHDMKWHRKLKFCSGPKRSS